MLHKRLLDQPTMHIMTWEPGGNNSGFSRQMWFEFIKSFWNFLIWKECQCRQMKHFRPNCSSLPCATANSFPTIHCLALLHNLPDPTPHAHHIFRIVALQDFTIQDFYLGGCDLETFRILESLNFSISAFRIMTFRTTP